MSSDYNSLEYILPVSASKDTHSPKPKEKEKTHPKTRSSPMWLSSKKLPNYML